MRIGRLACSPCVWALLILSAGCEQAVPFPASPMGDRPAGIEAHAAYDTNGDGKADFFYLTDATGRVDRIAYADGQGNPIPLPVCGPAPSRHIVLILDGVGFDLITDFYADGHLRMFHPPSRVISPYPSMTDICLTQVFNTPRPLAYEALYFDREANRLVGGSQAYLDGTNEPHLVLLDYSASTVYRGLGFVWPGYIFGKEIGDARRTFEQSQKREFIAYFGSTAGLGTQEGRDGHTEVLEKIEHLVNYLLWDSRGDVNITLMSDHGHSYTPAKPWPVDKHLADKGWTLGDHLDGDRSAVQTRFGLVTFACFNTDQPAQLAGDLLGCEGIDLISYTDGDQVVVMNIYGQRAVIRHRGGRFSYEPVTGDPLMLGDVLAQLSADGDGYYDARELAVATAWHVYPAPLQRLWEGHFTVVDMPANVIVSLRDDTFTGSDGFAGSVNIASTHGSLNRQNTTAFIMSTAGPLQRVMRSKDVAAEMTDLLGRPWPMGE